MDDFESWTRAEIALAEVHINEMKRALSLFLSWRNQAASSGDPTNGVRSRRYDKGDAAKSAPRERASKNDAIFAAFDAAGSAGLSQDDVQRVAQEAGLNTNPNALRALCWTAKKAGRLISLAPGRYAIPQRDEAAPRLPDGDGDAASARLSNDRHREGDAGGGIS